MSFISDSVSNKPTASNVPIQQQALPSNTDILTPPPSISEPMSPAMFSYDRQVSPQTPLSANTVALQTPLQPRPVLIQSAPAQASQATTVSRKRKNKNDDVNSVLLESIQMDIQQKKIDMQTQQNHIQTTETQDPDTLFCLSLVQEFKDLKKSSKKRAARLQILKVFCDMHDSDEEE